MYRGNDGEKRRREGERWRRKEDREWGEGEVGERCEEAKRG